MTTTTFVAMISFMIVLYFTGVAIHLITGGKGVDYKLALRHLMSMVETVLVSIFTITYLMGSIVLFISTMCLREMGHTDSHHTVDISMFGYRYTLTTKK